MSCRSLRTEYRSRSSRARSSFLGRMEGGQSSDIAGELGRQLAKGGVHHLANRPQRVVGRDLLLGAGVAEHPTGLLIVTAHAHLSFRSESGPRVQSVPPFQHPASVPS